MPNAHVNGVRLSYDDSDNGGEPVVLLHGYALDSRMWPAQRFALDEAGYRVIRVDARGHGRSEAPAHGYTATARAEDVRALLDQLDIAAAHLVGFDQGGATALHFALDHPGRTRALVLLAPTLTGLTDRDEPTTVAALRAAVHAEGWRGAATRLWFPRPSFDRLRHNPAAFQAVREIALDYPAADLLSPYVEDEGRPALDRLAAVRAPTLVLVGAEDITDHRRAAALIARAAPRARLVVVPDVGHVLPLERPADVNRWLLAMLADPAGVVAARSAPLTIRAATSADAPALAALDGRYATDRAWQLAHDRPATGTGFSLTLQPVTSSGAAWSAPARPAGWWREQADDGALVLAATRAGRVVGALAAEPWAERRLLWLSELRVDFAERFAGIGRALVVEAATLARAAGLRALRAELPADNDGALACLLCLGFRLSGADDGLPPPDAGPRRATLFLTLDLPAD